MINVVRETNPPTSLNNPIIQQYLIELSLHLEDSNNKRPEKPISYRSSDLLDAFDRVFHSKCYLTEEKFSNSYIMDVEHFIPQNENPALVYDWENLYPASHYPNMIRTRVTPHGGYMNPCNPKDNVELEIIYSLSDIGYDPHFEPLNSNNIKAVNSCNLLERLHNGHDSNTRKGTKTLRHAIHKKYVDILNLIIRWRAAPEDSQEKFQAKRELKEMLSRKSAYTMLCRSIPAVQQLPSEFLD